ncbi:GNAT family N-acetyltransferase [Aminomonas paucivorans]|uniref:GNAT family N-acetyltransferase n=1 Tax=Aminomonas paucivorans TaxID=81412 RepID=UPI003329A36B
MQVSDGTGGAFSIRPASREEVPLILGFIRELAEYETLGDEVEATEALLEEHLFGPRPCAEVLFACWDGQPVGFALYFWNFSTFTGRPGLYLEDLYVRPPYRGRGIGKALLAHLAALTAGRKGGRFEWGVLVWNTPAREFYASMGACPQDRFLLQRMEGEALLRLARAATTL